MIFGFYLGSWEEWKSWDWVGLEWVLEVELGLKELIGGLTLSIYKILLI